MAKFNLENYETVEDRLKQYWKDNPNGRIWTEVVHETEDGSCVTIRALVYINADDSNPISTGIAQETKGQGGFANTDAWVENCETSAIGRALAMMGIGIDTSIASANEVQEAIAKQTSTTTSDTTAPENVMDKAVGYLKSATDKRKAFDQVIGKYGEQLTEKQVAGLKKFVR